MTKLQNKVLGSSKVSTTSGSSMGTLPQRSPPNPSQHGMNAPEIPPSHIRPPSQADYKPGGRDE
jgi:hypothetical protein